MISSSVKNGEFRQYRGARDKDSFISFIEEKKWKDVETLPGWKDPKSMQMAAVSQFFKVNTRRLLNTRLHTYKHSLIEQLLGL